MMRLITLVLQIAFLAAIALWLADNPGSAHIVWHDTVIETSAAFMALCVLALGFAFYLLFRLWHLLRHGPANWRLRRKLGKMQKAQDQLTKGLIAIASGNASEAGRLAVAARKSIGNGIAAQWLQAQAAQLAGDRRAALEIFRKLASDPEAAVLGYRGLITEARRLGRWDEVDRLIAELHKLKPATPWLSLMRMESAARHRQWDVAESALSHAVAARLLETETGKRTRAALRIAASRTASLGGDGDTALRAAEQAVRLAPEWLPATINLAGALAAAGQRRAALRLIERGWKTQPHPQLAQIARRLSDNALDGFKQIEKLARANEVFPESRLALAEAALDADIWGEARRHLLASVNDNQATQNTCRLLARLERRERGDERAASLWLMKSAEAAPDPAWICGECGGTHDEWHPLCSHCGAFNKIEWLRPGKSRVTALGFSERGDHV